MDVRYAVPRGDRTGRACGRRDSGASARRAGYLPTQTSENSVGYSGGINVGKIGHEGGYRLCDIAVECINAMFK